MSLTIPPPNLTRNGGLGNWQPRDLTSGDISTLPDSSICHKLKETLNKTLNMARGLLLLFVIAIIGSIAITTFETYQRLPGGSPVPSTRFVPRQEGSTPLKPSSTPPTANGMSGATAIPPDVFTNSSTWPTFTDSEKLYRIQYPPLGMFFFDRLFPRGSDQLWTTLGWKGNGEFGVSIEIIDPRGRELIQWFKDSHGIDLSNATSPVQSPTAFSFADPPITVNGMPCIIDRGPKSGDVIAYLESYSSGRPLIYVVTFTSYSYQYQYPPFWNTMLRTFEPLAQT